MGDSEDIRKAVKSLNGGQKIHTLVCEVVKVDWGKRTCHVKHISGIQFYKARLRSVIDDKKDGLCLKPKKNSMVTVQVIEGQNTAATVISYSEVESIELIMQDVEFTIDSGKVKVKAKEVSFNDGNNDGLVIVSKVKDKINAIEDKVNSLLNTLKGVSVALAPSGSFPFSPIFSSITPLQKTQQSDIENTKVKH